MGLLSTPGKAGGCRQIPASGRPPTPVLTSEDPCCQGHRVAPSSGPCASARGCLPLLRRQKVSLCIRRTCLARNSDDKPWPSGRLTHSFHPVPFRAGGGGGVEGSCSCPHVVPGCSLQGGPPSTLLDSLASAPPPPPGKGLPACLGGDLSPCTGHCVRLSSSSSLSCTPTCLAH